jgi:hypothetical protein
MLIFSTSCVLELNVTVLIVIPVPEKLAVAPEAKPVPVTVTRSATCPWKPRTGVMLVRTGGRMVAVTLKEFARVADFPSVLVTVNERSPTVADAPIEMLTVKLVAELRTVLLTIMSAVPKLAVIPTLKFAPTTAIVRVAPCAPVVGEMEVIVGAGSVAAAISYAPISQAVPCGRATPRMSVAA